ncbi:regulatory helix-turn-helix protein, lysR family [Cohnella sp. OV330]|uniref:LysR family transcriptional regulator n=1 Tax=Cohnella sp. OV330 TaxID=1855288 RepID=UPI0008EE2844|nr:LysR family transcriptional regulator [Cohnella sp. OV330]SFB03428.1 regulatory helix-turn-helix protein, lysR family [Cohnella sp. OV330]
MEIKQLTTIQMILNKGSFLKAAESLGYAPSTISLHIQQLEAYLGIRLFEKRGRSMALTTEGQVFWENERHLLEQFTQLKDHTLSELSKTIQGHEMAIAVVAWKGNAIY